MADLIEKIGRFFAEQEAQIQETYTQAARVPTRALPRPSPPVHKVPTYPNARPPDFDRGSPVANPISKPLRNTSSSVARPRLSFKSDVESAVPLQSPQCPLESINQILNGVQQHNKVRDTLPLSSSVTQSMSRNGLPPEDIWSRKLSGGVVSWTSSSPASTSSSRGSSVQDEGRSPHTSSNMNETPRKPRPPQQKNRKCLRKKKRGMSKHPGNQEDDQPDPKRVAKENAEKVAAALVLAQERAKRIQQDKLQSDRERELERQETAFRLQEQMTRIEAVRARSFRHSSSSTMTPARSLSYNESKGNDHETDSVWTADASDIVELHKTPSAFMAELEAQLRDKMSLEMHLKQSCIAKHKQRERVRLKLDKFVQQNAVQSSKVARLSAMKASLEMELAAVLDDTAQTRQQRRELELADEKERVRRQREAERALQIRLREEEWTSMMVDEKARSQVAAAARVKASKRVEAHSAKLRRMLQAYQYEPRHSMSSDLSTSTRSNNNNDVNHSDDESDASISRSSTENLLSKPVQPFKMNFLLPPELADFEEVGLCGSSDCLQHSGIANGDSEVNMPNNNENSEDCTKAASPIQPKSTAPLPFQWQIPTFPDQLQFSQVLLDMISDDEDK